MIHRPPISTRPSTRFPFTKRFASYSSKREPCPHHPPYRRMKTRRQPAKYHPEAAILSLGEKIGDPVTPADFPATILHFRNDRWAEAVGLGGLTSEEWVAHFGQFQPLADTLKEPLALRYHGHQFHVYKDRKSTRLNSSH